MGSKCLLVNSLEGAEWISNKGLWRLPLSQYATLMKTLPAIPGVRLDVEPLPPTAHALVQVKSLLCRLQSSLPAIFAQQSVLDSSLMLHSFAVSVSRLCMVLETKTEPVPGQTLTLVLKSMSFSPDSRTL